MSKRVQEIIDKTNALIAQEEAALAKHPECGEGARLSIASLKKMRRQLEAELSDVQQPN